MKKKKSKLMIVNVNKQGKVELIPACEFCGEEKHEGECKKHEH